MTMPDVAYHVKHRLADGLFLMPPAYIPSGKNYTVTPYIRADLAAELVAALREAGDVIECYHRATGIDLGDASSMPFYMDTIDKVDTAIARYKTATEGK